MATNATTTITGDLTDILFFLERVAANERFVTTGLNAEDRKRFTEIRKGLQKSAIASADSQALKDYQLQQLEKVEETNPVRKSTDTGTGSTETTNQTEQP